MSDAGPDDGSVAAWLARIAAGGAGREAAARSLVEALHGRLLAWLRRHGARDEEAEDVLQDAFVKIVAKAGSYAGRGSARGWVYAIVHHQWVDHVQRRRPELNLDEEGWAQLADSRAAAAAPAAHADDCVDDAFGRFGREHPARADALRRMVFDGWSVRDIAAALSRSEGATHEYLSQCRKKLRPYLAPCLELLGSDA